MHYHDKAIGRELQFSVQITNIYSYFIDIL